MADRDVLALLCEYVTAELAPAGTDLPPRFDERPDLLPYIQLQELPSAPRHTPWNGPAINDQIDIDVDVFAAGLEAAADLARFGTPNLRSVVESWSPQGITVLTGRAPTRRPERNPNVQRYGCVFSFLVMRG